MDTSLRDDCPFCKIVKGDGPADVVFNETEVLTIRPLGPVNDTHLLIIPKWHVENFAESPYAMKRLCETAATICNVDARYQHANLITSMGAAATQTVMHLHVHLIGRETDDGLTLPWGKLASEHKLKEQPA